MKRQATKATKLLALTMSTILAVSLTACGDGKGSDEVLTPVEAEPILSDLELEILNLETKYNKGEFEQEDYLTLADAYHRAGAIRKQRDLLEQSYRLYADEDAFATLQTLSVNLEEEAEDIRTQAQAMQAALELTEDPAGSIRLVDNKEWFLTMMPKLKEGKRDYYLEQEGEPLLYLQVGYAEDGSCYSKTWYTGEQSKRYLSQEGATIRVVTVTDVDATPLADTPVTMDAWSGSFDAWSIDCATGSITHEQGTLQNGMLTGEYTCLLHDGEGGMDAASLWNQRENVEYVAYTGSFDAEGKILTEQPTEEIKKKLLEGTDDTDLILYAYDATGEHCLWQGIAEGVNAADFRFDGEMIGLETRPEYTSYEVTETTDTAATDENTENSTETQGETTAPQIRIFDGEIQWFDGKYWVSAGKVKEMEKQDPFIAYEEEHSTVRTDNATGSITGNSTGSDAGQNTTGNTNVTGDKNSGSIQKATPTPKPTNKPATNKPATNKPTTTVTTTPAPTQAPAQSSHDDHDDGGSSSGGGSDSGSSSGSSDSGSSSGGSSDSGNSGGSGGDSGSSSGGSDSGNSGGDSGSSGGSDVDMDWTPDLL